MSAELSRLHAEFTAELATLRQKDEQKQQQQQLIHQQNRNQQVQQNVYQHPRHQQQQSLYHRLRYHHHLYRQPQTQASYLSTLQKRNRNLPIWSTNYFALYRALQRRSGLARFVGYSGKSHFVRLYTEGLRKYVEETREKQERETERESEGREVLWPNVQVVVGRGAVGM